MKNYYSRILSSLVGVESLRVIVGCWLAVWLLSDIAGANIFKTAKISDSPSEIVLLDGDDTGLTFNFKIGTVDFVSVHTEKGDFILPSVDGFSRSHRIGDPSLPVANRVLAIPFGCRLEATIVKSEYEIISLEDLELNVPIMPVQPPLSKSDDPAMVPFRYNVDIYQQDAFYQLPLAETAVLGTLRSHRLGLVSVSPFEYNPVEKKLSVCKNLTVRVEFHDADWQQTRTIHDKFYSPFFEPIYQKIFNNDTFLPDSREYLVNYPIKYVIIADRMFESQLQPFIAWKIKKGFNVVTEYTDVIGTSSTAIKNYIKGLYDAGTPEDPAPSYVLLVGDDQQVPAFTGDKGYHVTDLHFCEYTGDYLPEIYYGRFSAQSAAELQPQIDKTLEYEQFLMPDPAYLEKVTLVAGVDNTKSYLYCNGQVNYGTDQYFNAAHNIDPNVWLYPASAASGADDAIIETVNDGIGFYNYTAHCNHYGHSNPYFGVNNIATLTNAHKYLLGIGNCCESNTFGSDESSRCFGEAFLQAEDKGGIGYIGASSDTYWDEDYWWAVGYTPVIATNPTYEGTGPGAFDGIFHDHGEPSNQHYISNGAIFVAGNFAVMESGSERSDYYWEIYHLMGDPSVTTYFGIPASNNVTHPASIEKNAYSVDIDADPGSYIGISAGGLLYGAGYVNQSGTINIPLLPFASTGTADIVVCAQNKIPYMATIDIIETLEPHVLYESGTINDNSGNDNGQIEAGEPILLGVELKNVGTSDAYNVEAVLSSLDPDVTITDDFQSYGTIPGADGTSFQPDAFAFSFDADTPDGHSADFTLTVTGTGDTRDAPPWPSEFTLSVHRPSLDFVSFTVDDASENGNGLLEPGETVSLIVTIENSGSGLAGNIGGVLSDADACLSIDDASGFFGNIDAGGEADNASDAFMVTADPSCLEGQELSFDLNLSGDNGYTTHLNFGFPLGTRRVVYADDFSVDKGWTGLGGTAEWTIGPATGGIGGDTYGVPDPEFDHTPTEDNCVLGNDLIASNGGDYNPNLTEVDWAISPVIDCRYFTDVHLSFYRCLGIEGNDLDHAYLEIFDGLDWVTIFESATGVDESSWNLMSYDVSAYADLNPDFQIRFGLGSTNAYANYCGWNIDDIRLIGYDQSGTCGDTNDDSNINILDIIYLIDFRYKSGPAPDPLDNGDVNGDSTVDILDIVYLINYLYKSGPHPDCP